MTVISRTRNLTKATPVSELDQAPLRSYAATPIQMGLIYESTFAGRPWVNLEQIVCRLNDEPLDVDAMTQAWAWVSGRHDILRTKFRWHGLDCPMQDVLAEVPVHIDLQDLSRQSKDAQDAAISDWLATDRDKGVDLTQGPCWRLTWFKLGATNSALVWTFHHALLDGRSFVLLLQEVFDCYASLLKGGPLKPRAARAKSQFSQHCKALAAQDLTQAKDYFSQTLAGFDAANKVDISCGDQPQTPRKQVAERILPWQFGQRLDAKAEATKTTVSAMVSAAWGLVVARSSNRKNAVFGVTRSGRHAVPSAAMIAGCLINTLPARITLDANQTIDGLLRDTRKDQLALRPFEQAPLADINRWSDVPGSDPLFETAIMFERGSLTAQLQAKGGIWTTRQFDLLEEGALPLTLAVYQNKNMVFRLEYDPSRYSAEAADRLLDYTITALDSFATLSGGTSVSDVQILPAKERHHLMGLSAPFAGTPVAIDDFETLIETFDAQVAQRRGVTAIATADMPDLLSYAELDRRANSLAQLLIMRQVGPGDLVAICLPRSVEFIVCMIAVIKSGAAFLPVDPTYPSAAIDHMLTDSDAVLLLTNTENGPSHNDLATVNVDVLPDSGLPKPISYMQRHSDPDRAAYVIYTSGSTGTPKGVALSHRALTGHIHAAIQRFELVRTDRVLQFASLSFDVALEEILPTLMVGAELVLRSEEMAQSMSSLLDAVATFEITVLNLPTALWHTLVDFMHNTGTRLPGHVRLMIVGGEAMSRTSLARWKTMEPELRCLNGYGPTEAAITSTVYDTTASYELNRDEDVPIGKPMRHARAYVLSPDGGLAPTGAAGELWLGGEAVALEYLKRPELTKDRFQNDPFLPVLDPQSGARMYRTGDIVRWRRDGNLAFGGRADRQVKVNGFRIELREVERRIEARDDVALAVAAISEAGTPRARLAAWVKPSADADALNLVEISNSLSAELPRHMVPALIRVDAFPKTPGGKIDVDALPKPSQPKPDEKMSEIRDPLIEDLREDFVDLLGDVPVGPDSSFYDLGGHSLLAIRLIGRLEQTYGTRLSPSALRETPTPRAIAAMLSGPSQDKTTARDSSLVTIQPEGTRPPIYGVHVLGTNEAFFRPLAEKLGKDQPVFGLSIGLSMLNIPITVEDTAEVYFQDIQRVQPSGPLCLAAVSQGSYIAFELAQRLRAAGRDVAMLTFFDAAGPAGRLSHTGAARIRTHLGLLLRYRHKHIAEIAKNRFSDLCNRLQQRKVIKAEAQTGVALSEPSVAQFVAANTLAIARYQARPYQGRLTVFRALESVFDTQTTIEDGLGWRPVADGGLDLIEVPGAHMSMLEDPNVSALAAHLSAKIDQIGR